MNPQTEIIRDISILYELSLSVGRSLDLKENCARFVKTLIGRKNLTFASVWVDQRLVGTGEGMEMVFNCENLS